MLVNPDFNTSTLDYLSYYNNLSFQQNQNPSVLKGIAKALTEMGRYNEAIEVLLHTLNYSSNDIEIYCLLGSYYLTLNKIEESLSKYMQALKINNSDPRIYIGIGNFYYVYPPNLASSFSHYKQAISLLNNQKKFAQFQTQFCDLNQINNSEKLQIIFHAAFLNLPAIQFMIILAREFLKLNSAESALKIFSYPDVKQNMNKNFQAFIVLGNINRQQNKIDEALVNYDIALSIKQNSIEALYEKAILLMSQQNYNSSAEILSQIIKKIPSAYQFYLIRGEAYLKIGEIHKSYCDYDYTLQLMGSKTQNQYQFNEEESLNEFIFIDQKQQQNEAIYGKATSLRKLKKYEEACYYYKIAESENFIRCFEIQSYQARSIQKTRRNPNPLVDTEWRNMDQYQEALKILSLLLSKCGESNKEQYIIVNYLIGKCYLNLDSPDEAILYTQKSWDELQKFNMNLTDKLKSISIKIKENLDNGRHMKENPSEVFTKKGRCMLKQKLYHEAISAYNKAISKDEGNIKALLGRGQARNIIKDIDSAIEDFELVIKNDQECLIAYYLKLITILNKAQDQQEKDKVLEILKQIYQHLQNKNSDEMIGGEQIKMMKATIISIISVQEIQTKNQEILNNHNLKGIEEFKKKYESQLQENKILLERFSEKLLQMEEEKEKEKQTQKKNYETLMVETLEFVNGFQRQENKANQIQVQIQQLKQIKDQNQQMIKMLNDAGVQDEAKIREWYQIHQGLPVFRYVQAFTYYMLKLPEEIEKPSYSGFPFSIIPLVGEALQKIQDIFIEIYSEYCFVKQQDALKRIQEIFRNGPVNPENKMHQQIILAAMKLSLYKQINNLYQLQPQTNSSLLAKLLNLKENVMQILMEKKQKAEGINDQNLFYFSIRKGFKAQCALQDVGILRTYFVAKWDFIVKLKLPKMMNFSDYLFDIIANNRINELQSMKNEPGCWSWCSSNCVLY